MSSIKQLLLAGFFLRLLLILYARWHDTHAEVAYTDIDYVVFTNASRFVWNGDSPYDEPTYRYTPLLAYLLLPNVIFETTNTILHNLLTKDWGKLLFSAFDILAAAIIWLIVGRSPETEQAAVDSGTNQTNSRNANPAPAKLLERKQAENNGNESIHRREWLAVSFWLFNPLTAVLSSRGSAESLMSVAVLLTFYLVQRKSIIPAALVHGLAIHFKLYPVIYLPSVFLFFADVNLNDCLTALTSFTALNLLIRKILSCWRGFLYILVCVVVFSALFHFFRDMYGYTFVFETYLYHMERIDTQHNFSPYYYAFHLLQQSLYSKILARLIFIPQAALVAYFSLLLSPDLPMCWFSVTFAFVSWNKVCTSQYFLWYLTFLPLILHRINLKRGVKLLILWFLAQGVWLFCAYLLEFRKWNVEAWVGFCSLLFLFVNMFCLVDILVMSGSKLKSE